MKKNYCPLRLERKKKISAALENNRYWMDEDRAIRNVYGSDMSSEKRSGRRYAFILRMSRRFARPIAEVIITDEEYELLRVLSRKRDDAEKLLSLIKPGKYFIPRIKSLATGTNRPKKLLTPMEKQWLLVTDISAEIVSAALENNQHWEEEDSALRDIHGADIPSGKRAVLLKSFMMEMSNRLSLPEVEMVVTDKEYHLLRVLSRKREDAAGLLDIIKTKVKELEEQSLEEGQARFKKRVDHIMRGNKPLPLISAEEVSYARILGLPEHIVKAFGAAKVYWDEEERLMDAVFKRWNRPTLYNENIYSLVNKAQGLLTLAARHMDPLSEEELSLLRHLSLRLPFLKDVLEELEETRVNP